MRTPMLMSASSPLVSIPTRTLLTQAALRERVETLLREYVAASGDKVKLVVTDPRPDTKEEQRAQRHGIAAKPAFWRQQHRFR